MRPTRGGLVATAALLLVRATMSSAGGGGGACNDTAGDDVVRRQPRQVAHVDHLALPHSGSTTVATALRRALEARALLGAASCAKCSAGARCRRAAVRDARLPRGPRALPARGAPRTSPRTGPTAPSPARGRRPAARARRNTRRAWASAGPRRASRPGAVVTVHVLREPVTWLWRTLMRFSYMPVEARRGGSRTASERGAYGGGEPASAWLERNPFAWNMQAQFLAGRPRFDCNRTLAAARDDADPDALLRAEAELADEAALAFGLFERLEDSAQLIAHALCLPKATLVAGVRRARRRRRGRRGRRGPRDGAEATDGDPRSKTRAARASHDRDARLLAHPRPAPRRPAAARAAPSRLYGYAARLFDDRVARMRRDEAAGATCRPGGDAACALRCS
ncbi:hypothetical protein JL720_14683 [Aureococcus anophagefferens]|nr:hypothetical protein JL720_14683 [Aureococcus anophagefferens]